MTFTIAIGLGLTERVLGCDVRRECDPDHVGLTESERLMGGGREFGRGPLPTFLAALDSARRGGASLATVLVSDESFDTSRKTHRSRLPGILDLDGDTSFVTARGGCIPWPSLLETIERVSRARALMHDGASLRFLILGCHTERHVLSMALLIRSILPEAEVAVSPHLVGSGVTEAHFAALRHNLPLAGVHVLHDLAEAADFASIDAQQLRRFSCTGCLLEPKDLLTKLTDPSKQILEGLCLHWTHATLKPLSGGFSGSLLMVASGRKNGAETEPMVIKVDRYSQMRREIDGYHLVKDFLGNHVPTFGYPVSRADMLGVGMELAAMEGYPVSLQESFEETESEAELDRYMRRLEKALHLISNRLHRNTRRTEWVSPYRAFHLHTDMQRQWLRENVGVLSAYWERDAAGRLPYDARMLESLLRLVGVNEDGVEGDICLVHGDLNFKNIICDDADNVWFIDWTHSGWHPVELDFAKLENDTKFVISKQFDMSDLPRLRQLEDYFLAQPMPAAPEQLPEALRFARWDLRFRKILLSVRRIREVYLSIKQTEPWLIYRAALLKYSLHTLSFDKQRNRGECDLPQLAHALHSTETLLNDLVVDDFQLRIRGERPPTYPPRQRISIDLAPWSTECPEYAPPYHVEPAVLAHDCSVIPNGWAEPEDIERILIDESDTDTQRDEIGRPLHPFGRTGIAGRGALGSWGPNLAMVAIITRARDDGAVDVLLGSRGDSDVLRPPQGWIRRAEDPADAFRRIVCAETGWCPRGETMMLSEAYGYDCRRTDHAWVVMHTRLLRVKEACSPANFSAAAMFESVAWYPLDGVTINRVPAGLARRVRDAVKALAERGELESPAAGAILAASG